MKMIVGLGNPGKKYDKTRHNIGFSILDSFLCNETWKKEHNSLIIKTLINNNQVLFVKPLEYMNLSGNEVAYFAKYYKITNEDILIIHDDMDLKMGNFRVKVESASGGHNGIKSIIECLQTKSFCRLKVGISHQEQADSKQHVLGNFTKLENEILKDLMPVFHTIITDFIKSDVAFLMNKYNYIGNKK